jgi:hypothetical protein
MLSGKIISMSLVAYSSIVLQPRHDFLVNVAVYIFFMLLGCTYGSILYACIGVYCYHEIIYNNSQSMRINVS